MGKPKMKDDFAPTLGTKIFLSVIFVIILIIPIAMQMVAEQPVERKIDSEARKYALELFGFYLQEANRELGIEFVHKAPELDSKINHILPTIASTGASVSVVDFNKDGWNDFYLTNSRYGANNALYQNLGNGQFKDVADDLGIGNINETGTGVSMGSVWADFNNDGYEDLFIYKWGRPQLFVNDSGKRFLDVTNDAGLPDWVNSNAAIWLDYNNDGLVDLLIGGYYKENIDLWNLDNTLIMPESFEYATNGGRNFLMENQGDGQFIDVAYSKGLTSTRWTLAIGAYDFDQNGYPDLFIANDYSVDELYLNLGDDGFREMGREAKIGYAPKSGMNVSFGDVKNEGRFSVYVSNITEMGILLQGNNMWMPGGDEQKLTFSNNAGALGIELGGWSYGSQFGDLNNDGFVDLYLANGYISGAKNNSYWYDYSKVTGGNKAIIADAMNWPAMKGRSQSGYQHNKIWMNSSAGVFADVSDYISSLPPLDSRAVAFVDLWNNGSLDVIVANQGNEVSILKNVATGVNNWISFSLEGTKSNRSAIGSKVTIEWNEQKQSQLVLGGIGFASQNQRAVHFGLGESDAVNRVIINWSSGIETIINSPDINKTHIIKEGNESS